MKKLRLLVGLLGIVTGFCNTSRCESAPTAADAKGMSCEPKSCEAKSVAPQVATTADINVKQTNSAEKDKDLDTVVLGSADLSNSKE